jgi:hypothetical protein
MAAVPRVYSSSYVMQGPVDVWQMIPADVPPSSAAPVAGVNTLKWVPGDAQTPVLTGGYHFGSTEGPAAIAITEKVTPITDDQHINTIAAAFDTVDIEVSFTMKESSVAKLYSLMPGDIAGLDSTKKMMVLGESPVAWAQTSPLLMVGVRRDLNGRFYALVYRAHIKAAFATEFTRHKESVWKLTLGAVMDLSRVPGDELMQIAMVNF